MNLGKAAPNHPRLGAAADLGLEVEASNGSVPGPRGLLQSWRKSGFLSLVVNFVLAAGK